MNKTTITIGGKLITLLFGMWTLARMADRGITLKNIKESLENNPIDFIHTLLYLSACNAEGRNLSAYDEGLFWDYLDAVGLQDEEVKKALTCFMNSLSQDVPESKKPGKQKAAAKK